MMIDSAGPRDPTNPDLAVRAVVRFLNALEWLVLYEWLAEIPKLQSPKLAYWYVAIWTSFLTGVLGTSDLWTRHHTVLKPIFVALAGYRLFDILRWWTDFLLDRAHWAVISEERNLLSAAANLTEVTLVGAIWLQAAGQTSTAGSAMYASFLLVTQLDRPTAATAISKAAVAVTEIASLVLLLGGVATLIAEAQEKLHATGDWRLEPAHRARRLKRALTRRNEETLNET
jgi:hypothetical protein